MNQKYNQVLQKMRDNHYGFKEDIKIIDELEEELDKIYNEGEKILLNKPTMPTITDVEVGCYSKVKTCKFSDEALNDSKD